MAGRKGSARLYRPSSGITSMCIMPSFMDLELKLRTCACKASSSPSPQATSESLLAKSSVGFSWRESHTVFLYLTSLVHVGKSCRRDSGHIWITSDVC